MTGIELASVWQSKSDSDLYVEVVEYEHAGAIRVLVREQVRPITAATLRRNYWLIGDEK